MRFQQDGVADNTGKYGFIARNISWSRNFWSWRYQQPTKIMQFDTIRLFLWGYVKDHVYAYKPSTLEFLKASIGQFMAEMCQKVIENYLNKINACTTLHEGHSNDVVFTIKKCS